MNTDAHGYEIEIECFSIYPCPSVVKKIITIIRVVLAAGINSQGNQIKIVERNICQYV